MSIRMTLFPENTPTKIGFHAILESALRKSYTPYGREYLKGIRPASEKKEVANILAQVADWTKLLERHSAHPLSVLQDIRDAVSESLVTDSLLPLDDFVDIYQNARQARVMKDFFSKTDDDYPALEQIVHRLVNLKPLEKAIQNVVTERGTLRDDASPELKRIRNKINRERNSLRSTIQRVMKRVSKDGMTSDEGPTIRSGRMVIPIQAEFKRKVDGFIHDVSSSGQTVYLEPVEALQINNEIRQLEAEEQREIERIIRKLTAEVKKYADNLLTNTEHVGHLDAIHCRAELGSRLGGNIPQLSENLRLNIVNGKNPNLLLKNEGAKEPEPVIPLNLELNRDELALIITGPNAGGKSVAMKTAGLLCTMLQCGYPIPVQPDSELPVLSGLFVDMGDEQSIENDLSTFSSRLQWMRITLDKITPGALVLIDEAGSGTDPEEGGALFQSFVHEVMEKGARVIVTTHHGSLKVFAHNYENVVNGAMEFNQENLSPTYHFKKGIPGSSYAFEIADRMNLPQRLMSRARKLLGKKRDSMGELLVNLEKKMQASEELIRNYTTRLQELEKREKTVNEQTSAIDNKRKKIIEKAYRDAEEIMKTANRRIEEAVEKVVSEGRENKEKIREARSSIEEKKREIHAGKKELESEPEHEYIRTNETPAVGDHVLIGDGNSIGELVELNGSNATVLMNGMRIKAKLKKLTKTKPAKKEKESRFSRSYSTSGDIDLSVKPSLDLRGRRGDAAIKELTTYLDKAIARGLKQVEIIHGKGEGILHKLVHEYLEKRDEVQSFDIAPWESGGTGCTVVNLQ